MGDFDEASQQARAAALPSAALSLSPWLPAGAALSRSHADGLNGRDSILSTNGSSAGVAYCSVRILWCSALHAPPSERSRAATGASIINMAYLAPDRPSRMCDTVSPIPPDSGHVWQEEKPRQIHLQVPLGAAHAVVCVGVE